MGYFSMQLKRSIGRFIFTPYFGIRKLANIGLLGTQFFLFKNSKLVGYPFKLSFDPCSICQLNCPLCPTGQGKDGRSLGRMDFEKYKKVLEEMAPFLYEADLNNWGEPFLNKELLKMVELAHKKRIKTSVNTNLNVKLGNEAAEAIVKSGLDVLYISMDGITQEVYEKYRAGGKLSTVWENIGLVAEKKKQLNSKTPEITWQFLIMKHNEHQLPVLEKTRQELGIDRLVIGGVRSDMGKEIFTMDAEKVDSLKKWLPSSQELSRYDLEKKRRKNIKKTCGFLWFVSVINWNGSVAPCCANYNEKFDFGNAFEKGFKAVWNNEKYIAARKAVSKMQPNGKTVCDNCIRTGFID
ncbi:MAG: radical SAM protein [Candidatus ainarchaeum sp.]|nr:radical SAM protein [Candidatus ainarchaeum sp.]